MRPTLQVEVDPNNLALSELAGGSPPLDWTLTAGSWLGLLAFGTPSAGVAAPGVCWWIRSIILGTAHCGIACNL